jgi:hypothetical protein
MTEILPFALLRLIAPMFLAQMRPNIFAARMKNEFPEILHEG